MAPNQAFFPISELSSYQQRWTICARVTSKSQIRTFRKGNGEGKVFSVDLLDASGGEIRATFFNTEADTYFAKLEQGKVYTMSNASIRVANRQFNACNHRYELIFDKRGVVVEYVDNNVEIEEMKFHFVDLRTCQSRPLPCTVDLCGIVTNAAPCFSFTSQAGKELVKREIVIADDTASSIAITLWGERAKQPDSAFQGSPVIGLKGVLIKEWNGGRSGSLLTDGAMLVNPSNPDAQRLQNWWQEGGSTQSLTTLSGQAGGGGGRAQVGKFVEDLADLRRSSEQVLDQQMLFTVTCRLAIVQTRKQGEAQPIYYMACQEPKEGNGLPCNRRLDASGQCVMCQRAGKAAPRLNLRCRFSDYGESLWLTTFHEAACRVLGTTAEEIKALEDGPDGREAVEGVLRKRYFYEPLQVTVKAKLDTYQGEVRTNVTCVDARPVALGERGRALLKEIHLMLAGGSM